MSGDTFQWILLLTEMSKLFFFFFFFNGPSNKAITTLSQFYNHTPKDIFCVSLNHGIIPPN